MFQNLKNKWKNNCFLKSKKPWYFHFKLISDKNIIDLQCQTNIYIRVCTTGHGKSSRRDAKNRGTPDNFDAKQILPADRK